MTEISSALDDNVPVPWRVFQMMRRRDLIAFLSGAVALPLTAGAQQPGRSYRIAYLALFPDEDATLAKPFLQRLHELGYDEGKNITLSYRSADGRPERLPQLAAELVQTRPDVLVTGFGTLAAKAARAGLATSNALRSST